MARLAMGSFTTLIAATQSPDTDTLFTPQLRAQLVRLQTALLQQLNMPALLLKPRGPAIRTNTTQKRLVTNVQKHQKQLLESHATSPISQAILLSQSAPHTGAHLMQPNSEAYEAEDRCFHVPVARRLMLTETGRDILQTLATREEALYFIVGRNSTGLTQIVNPNLGKTLKVDRQTALTRS